MKRENKEGNEMRLSKKKVLVVALVSALLAVISAGTLAWFTDSDSVKNDFMVAGSEDGNPDDIFSVDVWEDLDGDGAKDEGDGQFKNILPGDTLEKVVHVENTGSYDQYIRVKIEVSNASVWQDVYDADMVPVTEFVDVDLSKVYGVGSYLEGDSFVYYLYYNDTLSYVDGSDDMVVFNEVYIPEQLTREQAAALSEGKFSITITADAVQTANVGDDVYEAFQTVGMEIETNTTWVATEEELLAAFANDGYIVTANDIVLSQQVTVKEAITNNLYLTDKYFLTTSSDAACGIKVEGELTIGGLGTLNMPGGNGVYLFGTLNIFGGNFVDDNASRVQETLINVYATGVLNIYAGTFNGVDYCVCVRAETGVANIYGGEYSVSDVNGETIKY